MVYELEAILGAQIYEVKHIYRLKYVGKRLE